MRVLCLTDFPMQPVGYRWIWDHLPGQCDEVDFLWRSTHDRSARWGKLLTRYPDYFVLGHQALRQASRQPYDLVVAWEGKVGIPLALLRRLTGNVRPRLVILAFAPGFVPSQFYPLIRLAMRSVDHITVPSQAEVTGYQRLFGLEQDRISVSRLGAYDGLPSLLQAPRPDAGLSPYIHSGGRTARDFRTLVAAVRGLGVALALNGRAYDLRGLDLPPNVHVADLVSKEQYGRLVFDSLFVVVPLRTGACYAAGLSQVVHAMMMGKAVVATQAAPVAEYVEHGVTGLLVRPGCVDSMRAALLYLLENPEEASRMGRAARQQYEESLTFDQFARRTHDILQRVSGL